MNFRNLFALTAISLALVACGPSQKEIDTEKAQAVAQAVAVKVAADRAAAASAAAAMTAEQKVEAKLKGKYNLTVDERNMATVNAKNYWEKPWLPAGGKKGQVINCRPSDSNANGLVTCSGYVPNPAGTFDETKMYCGYRPELVGCVDNDN